MNDHTIGGLHKRLVLITLAIEHSIAEIPHVLQAQRLFGDPDYLLRVIVAGLPSYQRVYDERIATLPRVKRLSSTLVRKSIVENRALPV